LDIGEEICVGGWETKDKKPTGIERLDSREEGDRQREKR